MPFATEEIASDILLLSKVDFCICTFSSHVGRVVYSLRSAAFPDAEENTVSLDMRFRSESFYFKPTYRAVAAYRVPGEMPLRPGDLVHDASLHSSHRKLKGGNAVVETDGLNYVSDGRNRIKDALLPFYKVEMDTANLIV